jgi:hypothetical protein
MIDAFSAACVVGLRRAPLDADSDTGVYPVLMGLETDSDAAIGVSLDKKLYIRGRRRSRARCAGARGVLHIW